MYLVFCSVYHSIRTLGNGRVNELKIRGIDSPALGNVIFVCTARFSLLQQRQRNNSKRTSK